MKFNFIVTIIAAIIPLLMGFLWYNPKVFGNAWMKACNINPEKITPPKPIVFLWSFLLSFLIAFIITPFIIHQWAFFSILIDEPGLKDPNSGVHQLFTDFMDQYGNNFRTFKHGAFHGTLMGLFLIFPIIGSGALFESKSFKYVLVNGGYWTVCLAIMGGIICQFG